MEQGWDPDVKKYFVRIMNTIAMGLLWLMVSATAGIYFGLAYRTEKPVYMIIFYVLFIVSLVLLLRYFRKLWKNE